MRHLAQLRYLDTVARTGSIRKAAEGLSITSTALNRRILALEEDLGVPIFERLARGVRLTTAGELLIHHVRTQLSDYEKLRSQIADLKGERRGHVAVACSQAMLPYFLPEQIARYRASHPAVTFGVHLRDREAAERALVDLSVDLALVFEPVRFQDVHVLARVRQPIRAVMAADHPLAGRRMLRLSDCASYPVAMPTEAYGVRALLDLALIGGSARLDVVVVSDSFEFLRSYPGREGLISFQISVGLPEDGVRSDIVSRPIAPQDVPEGTLYLCQLRGRTLPVAAAKFAQSMERSLAERFS